MFDFPQSLRCKHFMVPEWCGDCLAAFDDGRKIELHVSERIVTLRERLNPTQAHHLAQKIAQRKLAQRQSEKRRRTPRSGIPARKRKPSAAPVALARKDVISPVFGKNFDLGFGIRG